jgi:hypothetical protein
MWTKQSICYEVGSQRVAPAISPACSFSRGFQALRLPDSSEFGTFPATPSRTGQAPFQASSSHGEWSSLSRS